MESHQATKLDISGTAKAVISCFQKLGVSFDMNEVLLKKYLIYSQYIIMFVFFLTILVMLLLGNNTRANLLILLFYVDFSSHMNFHKSLVCFCL
jgi:hypothetical protein